MLAKSLQKTQSRNKVTSSLMLWAVSMTIVGSPLVHAQDEGSQRRTSVLEEVIVTATKRAENIQNVGIAISALTGEQMEALGFDSAQEVTSFAPGVSTVQPNGEANYSIAIRGVSNSDFSTNVEGPVAIYLDEVYISQSSGSGFMLFDMERVEILRGPQGTLYGRNATGGLAHFVTRKPSSELNGYAKVTVGDYEQIKFEGAVGVPFNDSLSLRASLSYHENEGYVDNDYTPPTGSTAPVPADKLNNADDLSARVQLLLSPSDNFEVLFSARTATQDIDTGFFEYVSSARAGELTPGVANNGGVELAPGFFLAGPLAGYIDSDKDEGDVYSGTYDSPGFNDLEVAGYSATVKWAINDRLNFTSISDLSTTERVYIEDSDASPIAYFNFFLTTDAEQLSQEIRFDYEGDRVKWVVGAYYMDLDIQDSSGAITQYVAEVFGAPAVDPDRPNEAHGFYTPYTFDIQSTSFFGQIDYAFSDRFELVLGLRSINDEKAFTYKPGLYRFLNSASRPGFNAPSNLEQIDMDPDTEVVDGFADYAAASDDKEIAIRLQANWRFGDDRLLYVSFNRGIRGSGFNAVILPPEAPVTYADESLAYGPEQLDAYEIGYKVRLGDIGRLNLAAYYYDYEDYQLFQIIGIDTITRNADEADAKGFEVELQLTPAPRWDILVGLAYNDVDAVLAGVDVTPVQSPEININALVRYSIPIGAADLSFQFDADYRDKIFFALSGLDAVTQDDYTVSNVAVTFTTERFQLSAFIRNVLDEEYLVQTFDLSTPFGFTEQYYGRPRWWGASARFDF